MRSALISCGEFCIKKDDEQLALDTYDLFLIIGWCREVHEGTVSMPCDWIRPLWARVSTSLPQGVEHLRGDRYLHRVLEHGREAYRDYRHAEEVASMFMRELGPAKEVEKATFDMLLDVDPAHCKDCGMCLSCHAKEVKRAVRVAPRSVRVLMRAIAAFTKSLHRRQKRADEDPPRRSTAGVKRGRDSDEWDRDPNGEDRRLERRELAERRDRDRGFDGYGGRDRSFDGREGKRRVRRRYQ
ncbi:hypothetical protein FGB62_19g288 [Gracilaria domingensis]|nr:hypothetical protein FGB62_19g288 [Gracilaria domingensis]